MVVFRRDLLFNYKRSQLLSVNRYTTSSYTWGLKKNIFITITTAAAAIYVMV